MNELGGREDIMLSEIRQSQKDGVCPHRRTNSTRCYFDEMPERVGLIGTERRRLASEAGRGRTGELQSNGWKVLVMQDGTVLETCVQHRVWR